MTGLMGLDTFHDSPESEIHPVHALAIRIAAAPNPADDAWAIFVRNWGNEGFCGSNQHYVERRSLSIRIPRPDGISPSATASIGNATTIFKHKVPSFGVPFDFIVNAIPGGDAVVTFHLNIPTEESYQYGELHLVWTPTSSPLTTIAEGVKTAQTADEEDGPEESAYNRALFNALSPAEQEAITAAVEAARPPVDDTAELAMGIIRIGPPDSPPLGQVVFDGPADRVQNIRDNALRATCAVAKNSPYRLYICEGIFPVKIDIEPGEFPNIIHISNDPNRTEVTTVAILGLISFPDENPPSMPSTVDVTTVRFGKTGTEAAPVQVALADANGDGTLDLVLRFRTQDTGLQCGDTSAVLTGKTVSGQAIQGSDTIVTICDETPPVITVSANPTTLWPPNSKMVPVTVSGTITDAGSGVNASTATYAVTDEYNSVQPSGKVTLGSNGSYTFTIQLQASRNGNDKDGRQYTITVSAQDNAGNKGSAATGVTVPHDQGK